MKEQDDPKPASDEEDENVSPNQAARNAALANSSGNKFGRRGVEKRKG